ADTGSITSFEAFVALFPTWVLNQMRLIPEPDCAELEAIWQTNAAMNSPAQDTRCPTLLADANSYIYRLEACSRYLTICSKSSAHRCGVCPRTLSADS